MKKIFTLCFLMALVGVKGWGQNMSNYIGTNYTAVNGTYVPITGSTDIFPANTTGSDDGVSSAIALPFDFYMNGTRYSYFAACINGWIRLGQNSSVSSSSPSTLSSTYTNAISSTSNTQLIAPMWDDLYQLGNSSDKVHYVVTGSSPNRVLTVEWYNIKRNSSTGAAQNFQVSLYETSGKIVFAYGTCATPSSTSASVGFTNTIGGSGNYVSISDFATTATASTTNASDLIATTAATSGLTYTFTPPSVSAAPTGLTFASTTASSTVLSWTAASPITNIKTYAVYSSTDNVTFTYAGSTTVGTNTYTASSLTPGTTYYWKVYSTSEGAVSTGFASNNVTTTAAATYYYVGAATGSDFTTAASWNTKADGTGTTRTTAATTDILIVDGIGTTNTAGGITLSLAAASSIGALQITNGTALTLNSSTTTQRIVTLTGAVGDELSVGAGSSLLLTSTTNSVSLVFSSTASGMTGTIAGTLTVAGTSTTATAASSNSFLTTAGTNTVVTVTSTGIINNTATANITTNGNVTGSAASLIFANGSSYNVSGATTAAPWIPLATWGPSSNLTISGITTSTVGATNNAQSFGNFLYNCPSASATMSFWTTTTAAVVQGNLTITATGSGKFRALTSGTLSVNGSLIVNGGTFEAGSSTGTLNVLTNININAGTFDIANGGAMTVKVKGNFIQASGSTMTQTTTTALLEFNGSTAQTLTLISGAHGTNLINARVNNSAGVNLTSAFSIRNLTVSLGSLTGAGALTYNGTSSLLTYNGTVAQTASTIEFPASSGPSALTINNTTGVTVPFSRTLNGTAGVLTLTAGILDNSGYILTVQNTAVAAITGYSSTSYVKGAIARNLPASLAASTSTSYLFPVGKSGYNPFELVSPVTNSGGTVTVQAEVVDGNAGGTPGNLMASISTTRYWKASITTGATNFTSSSIRLTDATGTQDAIAGSATQTGAYDLVGGVSPPPTVTATTILTGSPVTSLLGYYLMGNKAAATLSNLTITPTGNQCTNVARTVTVTVTPGGAAISSVTLNYQVNGGTTQIVAMTNTSGNIWTGTIPTVTPSNGTVTWSVTATDANGLTKSATGTSYTDEPLKGVTATANASVSTICAGGSSILTAIFTSPNVAATYTAPPAVGSPTVDEDLGNFKISQGATTILNNTSNINSLAGTIGTATGTPGGYSNFTAFGPYSLTAGQTYTFSATTVDQGGGFSSGIGIYIDYNRNGVFTDAGETIYQSSSTTSGPHTETGSFTIPASALNGVTRVRVLVNEGTITGPTQAVTWGEYEEYTLNVSSSNNGGGGTVAFPAYSWSNGSATVGTTNPLTVTPTATANYTITATDANGCTVTSPAVTIMVNQLPIAPTISNNNSQCGTGKPSAIVADPNGYTTPTFKWYADNTTTTTLQSSTSTTYNTSISATTTFYVSVTNPNTGCESPRTAIVVTVTQPDPVAAQANGSTTPSAVCLNSTIALTAVQTGSNNSYTFAWAVTSGNSATAGLSGTSGTSISATPTAAGTYTFQVTASAAPCTTVSTVTIVVNTLPVIDSIRANPTAVCLGSIVTLNAYSSVITSGPQMLPATYCTPDHSSGANTGGISSVTFNTLSNTGVTQSSPYYTIYPASGTTTTTVTTGKTYTLSVATNASSIVSVWIDYNRNGTFEANEWSQVWTSATSGSISITIPSSATAGVTGMRIRSRSSGNANGSGDACTTFASGSAQDYSININTIVIQDQSETYVWNPGNLSGSTVTTTPIATGTASYTVTVTNTSTTCKSTGQINVAVNPLPTVPTTTSSTQCGSGVPTASVADPNGYSTPTFKWYADNTTTTALQTSTSTTYTTSISATTTFYVSVVNPSTGCESGRTAVTATVTTADAVMASATPSAICIGSGSTLTAMKSAGSNVYTYTWTATSSNSATAGIPTQNTGTSISVTPTAAGTYTYQVSAVDGGIGGCRTTATTTLTVGSPLTAVTVSPASAAICSGTTQLLTASGGAPSPVTVLSENFDGGAPGWTVGTSSSTSVVDWYIATAPYSDNTGSVTFNNFSTMQGGGFAFSNSDAGGSGSTTSTILYSPSFNLANNYTSATLTFEQGYKYWSSDTRVRLQVSTDGGNTWSLLQNYQGTDIGTTTSNAETTVATTVNLTPYIGNADVRIRFNYASTWGYYWILDNIVVSGQLPGTSSITWSSPSNTDLFTNAAGTTAYVAGTASTTVYAKPVSTPVTYTATANSTTGCTATGTSTLTLNPATAITTQPAQPASNYCIGTTATALSVSATGAGTLSYQWYSNTTNTTSASALITGATLSTYTPPTSVAGTKYYYVVVSASTCSSTATSNIISITVNPTTVITTQPSTATITTSCAGSSVSFNVAATGTNLTYQWFRNTANGNDTTASTVTRLTDASATSANLTTTVQSGTSYYFAVVYGACGNKVSNVSGAVISSSTQITGQPSDNTYCQGATANALSVTASGSGLDYQWYSNTTKSNSGGTPITNATGRTYTPSTATAGTFYYYVQVIGDCGNVNSSVATIVVNPTPTATITGPSAPVCAGSSSGITITNTSVTTDTVYYSTQISGGTVMTNKVTIPANTGYQPNDIVNSTTTYTITQINNTTCSNSPSNASVTVTVNPVPLVASISGPDYLAFGKTGSYSDGTTGGIWTISSTPSGDATLNSSSANPVTVTAGNVTGTATLSYTVTNTSGCSTTATQSITIFNNTITSYRTKQDGFATDYNTWSVLNDNHVWVDATTAPTNNDNINVRHNVTLQYANYNGATGTSFDITSHDTTNNVTINGTLALADTVYFQSNGSVNFNGMSVTLRSSSAGTGSIGVMGAAIAGATNVTVQRYTDGKKSTDATGSRRAWRLVTSPVTGQTIRQSWQEGGVSTNGYGTLITGEQLDPATAAAQGYDYIGGGNHTSLKHYVIGGDPSGTGGNYWLPLSNTGSTTGTLIPIQNEQAYLLFVRGDRTVGLTGTSPATLRSTGTLQQGDGHVVALTPNSLYTLVGNPYASAIDFGTFIGHNSNADTGIQDKYYSWNSTIGTYGSYVLVDHLGTGGNYEATPVPLTNGSVQQNDNYRFITNGSGFFVLPNSPTTGGSATSPGRVYFKETDKAPGMVPPISPFRVVTPANERQLLVNLSQKDSDTSLNLADGFRARFSDEYSGNEADNSTAKAANPSENLGLVRSRAAGESDLIIEARADVQKTDTLYMKMWNVSQRSYQLQVQAAGFTTAPGVQAWLQDSYLGTKQAVELAGGITSMDFTVTADSGSWRSDRFMIVFTNSSLTLPVTVTKVKAAAQNGGVSVAWTVTNETNIRTYQAEKSADGGITFTAVGTPQAARNNAGAAMTSYSSFDNQAAAGDNLYRIRIEAKDGTVSYSQTVKVTVGGSGTGVQIVLYPNPVRQGRVSVQLTNLAAGTYLVSVYTSGGGQAVYQKKVTITQAGTTQSEELLLGSTVAQGSYEVKITNHNGAVVHQQQLIVGR